MLNVSTVVPTARLLHTDRVSTDERLQAGLVKERIHDARGVERTIQHPENGKEDRRCSCSISG